MLVNWVCFQKYAYTGHTVAHNHEYHMHVWLAGWLTGCLAVCMDDLSEIEFAKKFGVSTECMRSVWGIVWMFDVYADFEIAYTIFVANDESSNRKHKTSYRSSLVWKPNNFISKTIIKKKKSKSKRPTTITTAFSISRSLARSLVHSFDSVRVFSLRILYIAISFVLVDVVVERLFECCVCVEYANLNAQQSDAYESIKARI